MHDPRVPETLEGWSVLHQMFRIRWPEWRVRPEDLRRRLAEEAAEAIAAMRRGEAGTTVPVTLLGHKGDLMLVHLRRSFEELQAAQVAVARLGLVDLPRADDLVRLGGRARDVRDDRADPQPPRRTGPRDGLGRVRGRVRRRDGGAEKARLGPALGGGARATARLLLPDEQAPGRAQELVRRAGRGPRAHDARPRQDRPALRRARSARSSPGRSASTTGSGASTSSPTTPSSSRSSSTRCASTRPRPGTRSSARSTSACSSRRPSCRSTWRARSRRCSSGRLRSVGAPRRTLLEALSGGSRSRRMTAGTGRCVSARWRWRFPAAAGAAVVADTGAVGHPADRLLRAGAPVAGIPALTARLVASGLRNPLDLQAAPGDRERLYVGRAGRPHPRHPQRPAPGDAVPRRLRAHLERRRARPPRPRLPPAVRDEPPLLRELHEPAGRHPRRRVPRELRRRGGPRRASASSSPRPSPSPTTTAEASPSTTRAACSSPSATAAPAATRSATARGSTPSSARS